MTTVHISIVTAIGSFIISWTSIILGAILIYLGNSTKMNLEVTAKDITVNFYSFTPGVVFALFGAILAGWTVHRLIKK